MSPIEFEVGDDNTNYPSDFQKYRSELTKTPFQMKNSILSGEGPSPPAPSPDHSPVNPTRRTQPNFSISLCFPPELQPHLHQAAYARLDKLLERQH